MTDVKKKFFKRLALYRMQYIPAVIVPAVIWGILLGVICRGSNMNELACFWGIGWIPSMYSLFNTITYFYGKCLIKKYGYGIFSDVDPNLLKKHLNIDPKAFEEQYAADMKHRKAGFYMTVAIILSLCIHSYLAIAVALIGFFCCILYRIQCCEETSDGNSGYMPHSNHNIAFPDSGKPHSSWGDAHIRGTVEASSTGNALCGRHREDPFGDSWGGSMFRH
jgi:hypothetical protein